MLLHPDIKAVWEGKLSHGVIQREQSKPKQKKPCKSKSCHRGIKAERADPSCSRHSCPLSHPGIFWQLSQAPVVLLLSQIVFPWHILLASKQSQPVPQIPFTGPKSFVREKLPYLRHSLGRMLPPQVLPSSSGEQGKLSALKKWGFLWSKLSLMWVDHPNGKISVGQKTCVLPCLPEWEQKSHWWLSTRAVCQRGLRKGPAAKLKLVS